MPRRRPPRRRRSPRGSTPSPASTLPPSARRSRRRSTTRARAAATRRCPTAKPALDRALGTATILAGLKLDPDSIRAALLLGLPVAGAFDADAVTAQFGADVATLVAGVARMGVIRTTPSTGDREERAAQAENLRKMLLSMVEDIRVVLIKLAERTQALRSLMTGDRGAAHAGRRARCSTCSRRSPTGSASGS